MPRGKLVDRKQLAKTAPGRVAAVDANTQCAFLQALLKTLDDIGDLHVGCSLVNPALKCERLSKPLQVSLWRQPLELFNAGERPGGRCAVVQRSSRGGLPTVPIPDGKYAGLKLQRRRHTVVGVHSIGNQ